MGCTRQRDGNLSNPCAGVGGPFGEPNTTVSKKKPTLIGRSANNWQSTPPDRSEGRTGKAAHHFAQTFLKQLSTMSAVGGPSVSTGPVDSHKLRKLPTEH
ncbi:MAG: hypothetical protein DME65_13465 [Verrucomicrobia bacterium]|nr:MAG: hypothetical protein DME65_13465 [Verrucomicrobiota bacterium]